MTTLTIQLPGNETEIVKKISDIIKEVKGGQMEIDNDDDGFTVSEIDSLSRSLKEAVMIKKGELKPLSMKDLWDE